MAATQKPNQAPSKGKSFKRNESQDSAHAARQRKRDAKRKGLKAGSRQAAAQDNGGSNQAGQKKDPRIGSRKPVPLVVAESKKPAASKPAKPSKTPEQIAGIVEAMKKRGQETILITRVDEEKSLKTEKLLSEIYPDGSGYRYFKDAKVAICGNFPEKDGVGTIVVATGGTSDIPVAEEAALTAEAL